MKVTCISDLHGHFPELPGGDILIVAGDLTAHDRKEEYEMFIGWLRSLDYKKKVVIAGNHDMLLEKDEYLRAHLGWACSYLQDSVTEYEGIKIWGSPWTRWFHGINHNCKAFTKHSEESLQEKWDLIPTNIGILVTHIPPNGLFDQINDRESGKRIHVGSTSLAETLVKRNFPRLRMHVFGHIHEYGGKVLTLPNNAGYLVNASHVDEVYDPIHEPVTIETYFHNIKDEENLEVTKDGEHNKHSETT